MASQSGRDLELMVGDGGDPEAFSVVAGVRTRALTLAADLIEATTADAPDVWRRVLGNGTRRAEVVGKGVFTDAASSARVRAIYFSGAPAPFRLAIPGAGRLAGDFVIAELGLAGDHDALADFTIRLVSAGPITIEPFDGD